MLAPGALVAPAVVNAAGGRRADMAGALLLGTAVLSFVLVAFGPGGITLALTGAQAFAVARSLPARCRRCATGSSCRCGGRVTSRDLR
jgi:hypothetical protein